MKIQNQTIRSPRPSRKGFTLMELLVAMAAGAILTLCVGVLLADSQRNYNRIYGRVNGNATTDGYAARKAFDSVCRKASLRAYYLSADRQTLEVYYFSPTSTESFPDRYARFYPHENNLMLEHGDLQPNTWNKEPSSATEIILARDISRIQFLVDGTAMQMALSFNDPFNSMPVMCSSVRHNE